MKKRTRIIETIIFILIIVIIITISLLTKHFIDSNKPPLSNSNEIENYSETKIIKYSVNINNSNKYQIPLTEYIDETNSSYQIYITATDNIITTLNEKIIINYSEIPDEYQNKLINYCNSYDIIENKYRLKCHKEKNKLTLQNQFNINEIDTNNIKTPTMNIGLPINKNTKLTDYLNNLKKSNIKYQEVKNIE